MKKTTTSATKKKTVSRTTRATRANAPLKITPVVKNHKQCFNPWSLSIYVYWFIILFFIAATFYILGRSHNMLNAPTTDAANAPISEEALKQASDYYNQAKTKLLTGDTDGAIADLTTAIESDASGVDAYILRGEAYLQSGDYRSALNDFNTATEKDPVNAVAYYDRALLNIRLEDYNSALSDINNALAAQTANPSEVLQLRDLYARRGQLNLWLKNWEGAIADYTNSLTHTTGAISPAVYAERAEAYTAVGNYASAIDDYATAVRIISEQIQGTSTAEARESLSSNAMSYFEKSAALNLNMGNTENARGDLNSALTIAVALNDTASIERLTGLLNGLQSD